MGVFCTCCDKRCAQEQSSQTINTNRAKIYEEMNTMSKTLSLSLKEKLMNHQNSIFSNQVHLQQIVKKQEQKDMSKIYFQYQKKIHMNKAEPKIKVPPLFANYKKKVFQEAQLPSNNVGNDSQDINMMNFYSIFSRDDENAKRILKMYIQQQMKKSAINE